MLTLVQDIVQDLHVHDMNISEDPHFVSLFKVLRLKVVPLFRLRAKEGLEIGLRLAHEP